uniref:Midkine n=1 Tax=Oncorhynchus tshawytscha TaxID=74940 RepID=A0A8C8JEE5_ONCTS
GPMVFILAIYSHVLYLCYVLSRQMSAIFGWPQVRKPKRGQAECPEKCFVKCVPNAGDFGDGFCEATCSKHTTKQCNIPCNWKKAFGADCKYRFTNWGECDTNTGTKSRSGTLKKDLFKLELPCSSRPKGKGGKGRSDLNRGW